MCAVIWDKGSYEVHKKITLIPLVLYQIGDQFLG